MAYNANIPNANDKLSQSQAQIKANFQALAPLLEEGETPWIALPVQGSAPATDPNEIALYSKAVSGVPQLFMRQQSNGAEFNFTSSLQATYGWTRLPSGILIKWGNETVPQRNQMATVTYNVGSIPVFTNVFTVIATQYFTGTGGTVESRNNIAVSVGNFTNTTFNVFGRAIGTPGSTPSFDIRFLAIGI